MLTEDEIQIIVAVLHVMRKDQPKNHADLVKDEKDVRDVFHALDTSGYRVIPKGMVDALKKSLLKLR